MGVKTKLIHAILLRSFLVFLRFGNLPLIQESFACEFLSTFGRPGTEYGKFSNITNTSTITKNKVFVSGLFEDRIQIFDSNGNFVRKFLSLGNEENQNTKGKEGSLC